MKLQKLVFLAQGYSLALLDRAVYFDDTHAWQWGPVVPKLYKQLQRYGSGEVTEDLVAEDAGCELDPEERSIINAVWKAYKKFTASQLSNITHREGTPWSKTWAREKFGVIPLDEMKEYYKTLVNEA